MKIDRDTFTDLTIFRMQGGMAAALLMRGIQPTEEQTAMLYHANPTMRELGEFYHSVGVRADTTLVEMAPDADDAPD